MAEWVPTQGTLSLIDADDSFLIWRCQKSNTVYVSDHYFLVFAALRRYLGSEGQLEAPIAFEVGPENAIRWWGPPPPAIFGAKKST